MKRYLLLIICFATSMFSFCQCCDTTRCVVSTFEIRDNINKKNTTYHTSGRYCYGRTPFPSNLFDSLQVIPVHQAINKSCKILFFDPVSITLFIEPNAEENYWQIRSNSKITGKTALAKVSYSIVKINAKTGKIKKIKRVHSTAITHPYG